MAQFELNIYGENDEIVKRFETNKVRWGVFMRNSFLLSTNSCRKSFQGFRRTIWKMQTAMM